MAKSMEQTSPNSAGSWLSDKVQPMSEDDDQGSPNEKGKGTFGKGTACAKARRHEQAA